MFFWTQVSENRRWYQLQGQPRAVTVHCSGDDVALADFVFDVGDNHYASAVMPHVDLAAQQRPRYTATVQVDAGSVTVTMDQDSPVAARDQIRKVLRRVFGRTVHVFAAPLAPDQFLLVG